MSEPRRDEGLGRMHVLQQPDVQSGLLPTGEIRIATTGRRHPVLPPQISGDALLGLFPILHKHVWRHRRIGDEIRRGAAHGGRRRPDCGNAARLHARCAAGLFRGIGATAVRDGGIWRGEHAGPHIAAHQSRAHVCRSGRGHPADGSRARRGKKSCDTPRVFPACRSRRSNSTNFN